LKSLHIESENGAMEFNVHEHTDNSSPAQSMFDIVLSVPGRIVTFSTKSGILGPWKRDLAI